MPGRPLVITLVLLFLVSVPANSQTVGTKDATAIGLLGRAVNALTQAVAVNSITLTATVTRTVGPDVETGTATLEALGGAASRVSLALTEGQQNEILNQLQGAPAGQWSGADGAIHPMARHNCLTPASWFFPALALAQAISDPLMTVTYAGQENDNGQVLQHIRFWRTLPGETGSAEELARLHGLSAVDVYLDASNFLPVEMDFNLHPDQTLSVDIPAQVQYSGYGKFSGILLPTHVQKFINHSLLLDLNVTGASANTALSPADFGITATSK